MKLAQIKYENQLYIAQIKEQTVIPLDFNGKMIDLIKTNRSLPAFQKKELPIDSVEFLPPILNPSKIIAIGLNYQDHANEINAEIPSSPLVFTKFSNSLIGHKQNIIWDNGLTQKVDYEAELAIIIKPKTSKCSKEKALDMIWGYTCANDVSARDLQFSDGQWVRGKSLDTFCPLGPWVVLADAISNPQDLDIQCRVNGNIMQKSNTNQMIFPIPELIEFLSNHFTLFPGDIILTGTPSGVGAFRKPPVFLDNGDRVSVEIENIGKLTNNCIIV